MKPHVWVPFAVGLLVPLALGIFVHATSEAWLERFEGIDRLANSHAVIERVGKPRMSFRSDEALQRQADNVGFVCWDAESPGPEHVYGSKASPLRYLDPVTGARKGLPHVDHEVLFYYFPFRYGVLVYLSKDDFVEKVLFCFE